MVDPVVSIGELRLAHDDDSVAQWWVPGDGLTGWYGSPAPTYDSSQMPGAHGLWLSDSWLGGRTIAVSGYVTAPDRPALLAAQQQLVREASLTGCRVQVEDVDGATWCTARRVDEVLFSTVNLTVSQFSVQFLAPDPRRLGDTMSDSTGLASVSGGFTAPFTAPFTVSTTVVSGIVGMTNPGTIDGPVSLRIDGPVVGPVVTHTTSGLQIQFASSLSLAAGDWLDIDMMAHTALANGTASRDGWITARGWSMFEPGDNSWAFSALSGGAGALLTVFATPAWL